MTAATVTTPKQNVNHITNKTATKVHSLKTKIMHTHRSCLADTIYTNPNAISFDIYPYNIKLYEISFAKYRFDLNFSILF